ncbi:Heat shock transcription factor [Umbelopsis nana]
MSDRHNTPNGASGDSSLHAAGYKRKASDISNTSPSEDFANSLSSTSLAPQAILENLSSPTFTSDIASLGSSMTSTTSPITSPADTNASRAIMSTLQNQRFQRNVPAFLNKLYNMVQDPASNDLIRWSEDGKSFIVVRHEDLAKEVLPRFFKHNNFSSFVRQLNMYGFHKVPHLQQGVLQADSDTEWWEFSNPHFQRNHPDLLLLVTRKKGRDQEEKEAPGLDLNHILDEISAIKKHQMNISSELKNIQQDNQVLWQETLAARERHQRHQETIDKILRFLASVFSGDKKRAIIPKKRRFLIGDANTEYGTDFVAKIQEEDDDDDDEDEIEEISRLSDRRNDPISKLKTFAQDLDDQTQELPRKVPKTSKSASVASSTRQASSTPTTPSANTSSSTTTASQQLADIQNTLSNPNKQRDIINWDNIRNIQQLQNLQQVLNAAMNNPTLLDNLKYASYQAPPPNPIPTSATSQSLVEFDPNVASTLSYPAIASGANATDLLTPLYNGNAVTTFQSETPSLDGVTQKVHDTTKSAEEINQEIGKLESDIDTLTNHLGFDPSDLNVEDLDYVDMDEFLNTYGNGSADDQ